MPATNNNTEIETRGGRREGAGRPFENIPAFLTRETFTIRLPLWLIEKIPTLGDNRTEIIETALVEHYKLSPPRSGKTSRKAKTNGK